MIAFNFFTSLILFLAILIPIFIALLIRVKIPLIIQYNIFYYKRETSIILLVISIIFLIISSAISILYNSLHILNIFMIATTLCILLIIMLNRFISFNIKLRLYVIGVITIVIIYTVTVSFINALYPYYNDDVRDILASNKIIYSGSIIDAARLLQTTERYYSVLPAFHLLLTFLTYIVGDIKITYLLIGMIQLLGIVFGTFIVSKIINKHIIHKINNNDNSQIYITSSLCSLLIIGLPFGFFTILATQPQSLSILLALCIVYGLIRLRSKNRNQHIIIILIILVLIANIFHAIIIILLLLFGIYYLLFYIYRQPKFSILWTRFPIFILISLLIIIYWYDPSIISRLSRQYDLTINILQSTDVTTTLTLTQERLSEGFKFYAYSYAFLISLMVSIFSFFILVKIGIIRTHTNIKNIISIPNMLFTLILILIIVIAFLSTIVRPGEGLGRYLLGQGIIFIFSLLIVSNVLALLLINTNKRFILVMSIIFIYILSGLTQPYWSPDNRFLTYSTDTNYKNVSTIYNRISEDNIVYLVHNIPVKYDLYYTDEYLINLYKQRTDYQFKSSNIIEGEPIFDKISSSSQSVINFLPIERVSDSLKNSNKFNAIFMSNRYAVFYTAPFMVVR